jgi:hypothetical protein
MSLQPWLMQCDKQPLIKDVVQGLRPLKICPESSTTFHVVDYAKITTINSQTYITFNFNETIPLCDGFILDTVEIDACTTTGTSAIFYLTCDLGSCAPSSYLNGVPSNIIALIPGNLSATVPLVYKNDQHEWLNWKYPTYIPSISFTLLASNSLPFTAPSSPWSFRVSFYLRQREFEESINVTF